MYITCNEMLVNINNEIYIFSAYTTYTIHDKIIKNLLG